MGVGFEPPLPGDCHSQYIIPLLLILSSKTLLAPSMCKFLEDESSSLVPVFVVVVLPPFQLFCSMTAAISLLLSVVYQRVIIKSCDVYF